MTDPIVGKGYSVGGREHMRWGISDEDRQQEKKSIP